VLTGLVNGSLYLFGWLVTFALVRKEDNELYEDAAGLSPGNRKACPHGRVCSVDVAQVLGKLRMTP
jgi:hypothetical protein